MLPEEKPGNKEIGAMFHRLADLLEIDGANEFRVRAYHQAARVVEEHPRSIREMVEAGEDLTRLEGIGRDLAGKIATLATTGQLPVLKEIAARLPPVLPMLMRLAGLGPKRVRALYQHLAVHDLEAVRRAAEEHRIRELPGFGAKTEKLIEEGLARLAGETVRMPLFLAEQAAEPLVRHLRALSAVRELAIAGSYRRRRESVGDIDLLVTARHAAPVMEAFTGYGEVREVLVRGDTRSTIRFRSGLKVDLRVVPEESYGAALHYFTGSKAHNIAVRRLGVRRGLKINEYGVFRGERRVAGRSEESVFRSVGLPFIPPELREDRGEIEAARTGRLPRLIDIGDLRGDLHLHTVATDGHATIAELAGAAAARGYEYIAITDHTRRAVQRGLNEQRLAEQIELIDAINGAGAPVRVLKGIEVDILEDGRLDLSDELLAQLEVRVCSLHQRLDLPAPQQTARLLRALEQPWFNILAHPTGRLLGERAPSALDMERVITACRDAGVMLEVNANPKRLDLDDAHCRLARDLGARLVISSDSHRLAELDHIRFGIGQARRGWVEAAQVANTLPLAELMPLLRRA